MLEIVDSRLVVLPDKITVAFIPQVNIRPKTLVLLVGRNGQGKSAFMKAICKIKPFHIMGGRYRQRVNRFVYLDAEPLAGIQGSLTAEEMFRLFCRIKRNAAIQMLDKLSYCGLQKEVFEAVSQNRTISSLSSGQRQFLLMLAAINSRANFLFIDEGMSALDQCQLEEVMGFMRSDVLPDLSEQNGVIFLASHSVVLLNSFVDLVQSFGWTYNVYLFEQKLCREVKTFQYPFSSDAFKVLYNYYFSSSKSEALIK